MLKLLPQFKAMVLNNIDSSKTLEQLMVCHEMMELFRLRYNGFVSMLELHNHMMDFTTAYDRQLAPLMKAVEKNVS